MRRSKWLKWQIGSGSVIAIALVFHTVKTDPAFAKAHQQALLTLNHTANSIPEQTETRDPVFEEWQQARGQQSFAHGRQGAAGRRTTRDRSSMGSGMNSGGTSQQIQPRTRRS